MKLLGNDSPHDYVSWLKTPSFSGVQDKFGVLLTTKRGHFGPQNIVMRGIVFQKYNGFEKPRGGFRPIKALRKEIR